MAPHQPAPSSVLALPVHTPGLTRLAISPDGQSVAARGTSKLGKRPPLTLTCTSARAPRYIFTGGADTLVRVFQTAKGAEAEPSVLQEHSEEITFLDCSVRRQPSNTGTRKLS